MPVNPAIEGRVYPPTAPYLVGREKLREFARAVGADAAVCLDVDAARAAGHADLVAAPTFPIVLQDLTLQQLLADPDAGVELTRVVHGDQRFSYSRPIVAGDELTAVMTIASVKTLAGNTIVTAASDIHDLAGGHVVTATSTLVVRAEEA